MEQRIRKTGEFWFVVRICSLVTYELHYLQLGESFSYLHSVARLPAPLGKIRESNRGQKYEILFCKFN